MAALLMINGVELVKDRLLTREGGSQAKCTSYKSYTEDQNVQFELHDLDIYIHYLQKVK